MMALLDALKQRRTIGGIIGLLVLLVLTFAVVNKIAPVSSGFWGPVYEEDGVAIQGYDAVAYHTSGVPTPGVESLTVSWGGVTWRFASEVNRAAFEADPGAYAPQYGGFCATAVSNGFTASTSPESWHIEAGRLYLFHDDGPKADWVAALPSGVVASGDSKWATR